MTNPEEIVKLIQSQASLENIRITQHAQQEMVDEDISLDDVLRSIADPEILENYPQHRRGACCLLLGFTHENRPLHIVCTTIHPTLIIITVYEPKAPKWTSPTQRSRQR